LAASSPHVRCLQTLGRKMFTAGARDSRLRWEQNRFRTLSETLAACVCPDNRRGDLCHTGTHHLTSSGHRSPHARKYSVALAPAVPRPAANFHPPLQTATAASSRFSPSRLLCISVSCLDGVVGVKRTVFFNFFKNLQRTMAWLSLALLGMLATTSLALPISSAEHEATWTAWKREHNNR